MLYKPGDVVKSLAGHDTGSLYIITEVDGDSLTLADGKHRGTDHPKHKNTKHVQVIHTDSDPLVRMLRAGEKVTDEQIKRFLKTFGGN